MCLPAPKDSYFGPDSTAPKSNFTLGETVRVIASHGSRYYSIGAIGTVHGLDDDGTTRIQFADSRWWVMDENLEVYSGLRSATNADGTTVDPVKAPIAAPKAPKLEIYQPTPEPTQPVVRLALKSFPGGIRLVAVDANGAPVVAGNLAEITTEGKLKLFANVEEDLGLPLDSAGKLKLA